MENVVIVEKVPLNEPADWVSSLVCVDKPDGSIHVCLDPKGTRPNIGREPDHGKRTRLIFRLIGIGTGL